MVPKFHLCGAGALLMDVAARAFDLPTQRRLWSMTAGSGPLRAIRGVRGVILGVNNVLVRFDPFVLAPSRLEDGLLRLWRDSVPLDATGRVIEIPVVYEGLADSDQATITEHTGLGIEEVIRLHTSVEYHVACIGSAPGFAYLVGMVPQLAVPRRRTPRARVPRGAVAIGGTQTGIIPMDMPSGWNLLGRTDLAMFDPFRAEPCLFAPGDRVRFTVRSPGP